MLHVSLFLIYVHTQLQLPARNKEVNGEIKNKERGGKMVEK
jgi:hypothetical protein